MNSANPMTSELQARPAAPARFYQAFVFLCGVAVMTVEMAASRLLAPFFGDSLLVWSNLIGIIMLGLAAGYYWGGRYADRHPRPEPLFVAVLLAGLWVSLLPLVTRPLFRLLPGDVFSTPTRLIIVSFAGASLAFLPPVTLLGWVSPYVLRLLNQSVESSGRLAGRLYALSTVGSLMGTFLPSLVTIPWLGTAATLALAGALLIGSSAWGLVRSRAERVEHELQQRRPPSHPPKPKPEHPPFRSFFLFLFLGVPATVFVASRGPLKPVPGLVTEAESAYQFIQIWQQGQIRYLVVNEGGGIQSFYRPGSPFGTGWYYDYLALLPYLYRLAPSPAGRATAAGAAEAVRAAQTPGRGIAAPAMAAAAASAATAATAATKAATASTATPATKAVAAPAGEAVLKTLLIGYAGGTVAQQLAALPAPYRSEVVGVEIDPEMVRLARDYMGGIPPHTRVVVADGRIWLRRDKDKYDIIIVDAYSREMYIPFHLSTQEFFREAKEHLRPGGLLALNVNASQTGGLLASFYRTLASVFPHVYWARSGAYMNYLLVATGRPLSPETLPAVIGRDGPPELLPPATELAAGWRSTSPGGKGLVFTDDRAPVEWFTDWMVVTYPARK